MDVLLGSVPLRPHGRLRALTSSTHLLTSSSHPQTSSLDGWSESIDLLRVRHPPDNNSPSSSSLLPLSNSSTSSDALQNGSAARLRLDPVNSALCRSSEVNAEVNPEVVRMGPSPIGPRVPLADPPPPGPSACRACCQQDQGRSLGGGGGGGNVYYHPYHHPHQTNPYCRACQGAPSPAPGPTTTDPDNSSLYFNYLKYPSGRTSRAGIRTPHCGASYSTSSSALFSQQPYARVGSSRGQGEGASRISGKGSGKARINRNLFRFGPDLWNRLSRSGGSTAPGTSSSRSAGNSTVDASSVVETKAEAFVDGTGKTGKGIAKKNRGDGEGVLHKTYRNQRVVFIGAFLLAVFVMAAASVLGVVIMWTPSHSTASASSSSLATDLARSQGAINSNHVTEDDSNDVIRYITVIPSLIKATADEVGWAFYARGSAKGSKYTIINKPLTFYSAQEQCQKLGGYLVHVNTLREQLFLEDFLTQELEKQGPSSDSGIGFWMGAKRARGSHEGTCMFEQWKWVDSYGRALSSIAGLTAFIPGKPDNQYNPEECLFMSYKERTDENRFLKWDDAPCDLNSIGSIKALCEVEIR